MKDEIAAEPEGASSTSRGPVGEVLSRPLSRRRFLHLGGASAGALLDRPEWMQAPGRPMSGYGAPAEREAGVERKPQSAYGAIAPGAGSSTTPLERLEGTITPSGLHFERHHSGIPDVDPAKHRLLVDGDVERPLFFGVDDLLRYPLETRTCFIECSGNSLYNLMPEAPQTSCGEIHGLVSCSEWTGVPLRVLLEEAGLDRSDVWVVAEGADSNALNRSLPLPLIEEDAMIALYQNGERLRPEQGYPLRLLTPGLEGNVQVKWLRRLEVRSSPAHSREETSKYTDLMDDGIAQQFSLRMGVKSVITRPSVGMRLPGSGQYEISGLAWSGAGRIDRVLVSADGGETWERAHLDGALLPKSLTRFRLPWRWERGQSALLQSRAIDETGQGQPSRAAWQKGRAATTIYHYNAIQAWAVEGDGAVRNRYV